MNRTIEVTISPQGEVAIRTIGYSGPACLEASRFIEQALGTVASERKTGEFFQTAEAVQLERP